MNNNRVHSYQPHQIQLTEINPRNANHTELLHPVTDVMQYYTYIPKCHQIYRPKHQICTLFRVIEFQLIRD